MGAKTGREMHLYINTGTVATPTWTEVTEVSDVSVPDLGRAIAELKRRGNVFTKGLAGLFNLVAVEFTLIHGLGATVFTTIQTAFFAGSVKEWAVMDGPIATAGSQGLRLPALVEAFPWEQPLEDVSGHQVRLALAYMEEGAVEVDPSWYTVAG